MSSTRAKNRYNSKNYDRIPVIVPIGEKDKIAKAAIEQGYDSTNSFVVAAIYEKMGKLPVAENIY